MIKKLQWKIVLITISVLFAVFSSVLIVTNLVNYNNLKRNASHRIDMILEDKNNFKPSEVIFSSRYFKVINVDGNFEVDLKNIVSIDNEEAIILYNKVSKREGVYRNFYYKKYSTDNYIFLDISMEKDSFYSFLITSILVMLSGLLLISLFVIFFSKLAAKPMIESARERKEFISNINHQIKTPIAIIKSTNELIEMENGKTEWTEIIDNETSKMDELLRKVIFISCFDEENFKVYKEKINFSQIIKEIVDTFFVLLEKNNKKIELNILDDLYIFGEETLIGELISILIDNSIKYSINDSTIHIELFKINKQIKFKIINEVEFVKIGEHNSFFDRYYRDKELGNEKKGYGLGLSFAKTITLIHNGKIKSYSENNHSIIFEITF